MTWHEVAKAPKLFADGRIRQDPAGSFCDSIRTALASFPRCVARRNERLNARRLYLVCSDLQFHSEEIVTETR
jgi:hypothetical protein